MQQDSTAAGLESSHSSLPSNFPSGSIFKTDPGGGFFRQLVLFKFFLRLPLCGVDGGFRFLEGAEATAEKSVASAVLSRVLLCERFLDLVAGPDAAVSSLWAPTPTVNELFVLAAAVDPVTAAVPRERF